MSNKPLAYRLGFYISFAVLLVFVIFILWILNFHVKQTKKSEEAKAIQLISEVHRNIRDRILMTQLVGTNIERQIRFYHEHAGIETLLHDNLDEFRFLQSLEIKLNILDRQPLNSAYIAARAGNDIIFGIDNKSPDFCINEDTLIRYFPDLTKTGWSEPFKCVKKDKNISVYNHYFQEKDSSDAVIIQGSVKCELSIDSLQVLINKTKVYNNGYIFLTSQAGTYMTYPLQEFVLSKNIRSAYAEKTVKDSVLLAKFLRAESGPIIVYPPALKKVKSWAYPTLINETKWLLVITIPYSELQRTLFSFLIKMGIIMFIVLGAIFVSVIYIANRTLLPLSKISRELHHFSVETPEHRINIHNETVALEQSLAQLQERYEKYRNREEETAKKGIKFLSDLALASEIQQSIIPPPGNYHFFDGRITVHTVYQPAQFISGDLCDFFLLDDHRFLISIGDVSGKGIPAALFMGIAHTYIRSNSAYEHTKDILNQVNKQLCKNNSNQFFLTLFMGIIDIQKETLHYCNAGHTPTFLLSESGNVKELADQHGLPLGLYPDKIYQDSIIHIKKRDSLILYTDGITEQVNSEGEFFGVDSFYRLFNQIKQKSPEESTRLIMESVERFRGEHPSKDDLSLIVLQMS